MINYLRWRLFYIFINIIIYNLADCFHFMQSGILKLFWVAYVIISKPISELLELFSPLYKGGIYFSVPIGFAVQTIIIHSIYLFFKRQVQFKMTN